jgi:hypothetical protein
MGEGQLYGGGDVLDGRAFAFGYVEITLDSRGFWLFRVKSSEGGVPHWRFPSFGAIGYRTPEDAYAGAVRAMTRE